MGMHDRDYYKEWWNKRTGHSEKAPFRRSERDVSDAKYDPRVFRNGGGNDDSHGLPDVPGAGWHWATQVLVWLVAVGLLFVVFEVIHNRQAEKKVLAMQRQQILLQQKQIEELQKALQQQKPKIDFFK